MNTNKQSMLVVMALMTLLVGSATLQAGDAQVFSVHDFGAQGDGENLDTQAIQDAFDKCGKAGGGTVVIPKGTYLCGSVFMKSRTTLLLEEGATLKGSEEKNNYPVIDSRFMGTEQKCHASLINAIDVNDITITGKGVVAGSGIGGPRSPTGPRVIEFIRCRNILIENIKVTNKGRWTIHLLYCTNAEARGLDVRSVGPMADGIDPDSCTNVFITDCIFETGDDCIAIKSGKGQQAVDIGIPCQNITVTNCTMLGGHACVALGSEISGGIRNILVKDCVFKNMHRGFDVKTRKGRGGYVENVTVENIKTYGIPNAILMRVNYPGNKGNLIEGPAGISTFRNMTFKNFEIFDGGMGGVRGSEDNLIQDLTFINIKSHGKRDFKIEYVKGLIVENISSKEKDHAVQIKNCILK